MFIFHGQLIASLSRNLNYFFVASNQFWACKPRVRVAALAKVRGTARYHRTVRRLATPLSIRKWGCVQWLLCLIESDRTTVNVTIIKFIKIPLWQTLIKVEILQSKSNGSDARDPWQCPSMDQCTYWWTVPSRGLSTDFLERWVTDWQGSTGACSYPWINGKSPSIHASRATSCSICTVTFRAS